MSEQVLEQSENKALQSRSPLISNAQPKQGMFGIPEIIGFAFSGLFVLVAIISYFYFLLPAQSRLKNLQDERGQLVKGIGNAKKVVGENETAEQSIARINDSVINFERVSLRQRQIGKMALYTELNDAIRRNNLRNTDGPTYTALDALDPNSPKSQANKAGIARWQSLFPGINIAVTVEGSYMNLRRFIKDVEANSQFVIINAVQIEGQAKANTSAANLDPLTGNQTMAQSGEQNNSGINVSLRLDMVVYFQRGASPE